MTDKPQDDLPDENSLIAQRREKLDAARKVGNAYPNDFRRDALAGDLAEAFGGQTAEQLDTAAVVVRVAGRMVGKRVMGKASFVHIQDGSGRIQLFLQQTALGETYEEFKRWDVGDQIASGIDYGT